MRAGQGSAAEASRSELQTGWYISGAGHITLIVFVLFGGLFSRDRLQEVAVAEVSVMTEAEFAALMPRATAPDIATDAPEVTPPVPEEAAPEAPAEDAAPEVSEPEQVETPETPDEPLVETPAPLREAVAVEDAPPIPLPPTDIDGTAPEPDAIAAPAPRVAPVPQVAPPPVVEAAPEVIEDSAPAPDEPPVDVVEEETPPAAPEEASDRIVTEAEEVENYAPASSMRPRSRPPKPVRAAETPREQPTETRDPVADAVAAAVAEANTPAPSAPTGPPLTGGEKDALRVSVSQCWNVGSLSTEALATTVVVAVSMQETGVPDNGSIRMVSFSGGSEAGARQAFEAARRAIIRCGARGFPLPVEKYSQWRDIEMTFNPEGMQFR
ncbi:energy transducer TonB [Silicimonas sp. MF1-12-2]|uniref:energy transducer TonB n=1 Tax=Silicimonas sp. MF1-12-2 TaxID=3384793 RepID=UPI0039B36FE5